MQVIDYAVLRGLLAVDANSGTAFILDLTEIFATDARRTLERMRACARTGDYLPLVREAHRLKGSSGTLGADALACLFVEIERCARAGSCAGMEARIDHALRLLEASCGRIVEFFHGA